MTLPFAHRSEPVRVRASMLLRCLGVAAMLGAAPAVVHAADGAHATPHKPHRAARKPVAKPEPEPVIAPANDEQLEAAKRVFTGSSPCELNQSITLADSAAHPGYVDLVFGKKSYLMRPVLSRTGAIRLEDVRNETLLVQIGSKSMLMNQKTGQRLADQCVNPDRQHPDQ